MRDRDEFLDRLGDTLDSAPGLQSWEVFAGDSLQLTGSMDDSGQVSVVPHHDGVVSVVTLDVGGRQHRATTSMRPTNLSWLWHQLSLPGRPWAVDTPHHDSRWDQMSPARVAAVVERAHRALMADKRVRSASVLSTHTSDLVEIRNSNSPRSVSDIRQRARLHLDVTCENSSGVAQATARRGITGALFHDDAQIDGALSEAFTAVARAVVAVDHREGVGTVVFAESTAASLLHELSGHPLEADVYNRSGSVFHDRLGEDIASSQLTVFDDPTVPGGWGSYSIDDRGTRAARTCVIDRGRLNAVMTDSAAPAQGSQVSANARRAGIRGPVMPRMSNTVVARGDMTEAALISDVVDGWRVTQLGGAECNPMTGDYAIRVDQAQRIRRGRLEEHVRGGVIVGDIASTLRRVEAVASECHVSDAMCNKAGQRVPVGFVAPAVAIAALHVGT